MVEIKNSGSGPSCAFDWLSNSEIFPICLSPISHLSKSEVWSKCFLEFLSTLVIFRRNSITPTKYNKAQS